MSVWSESESVAKKPDSTALVAILKQRFLFILLSVTMGVRGIRDRIHSDECGLGQRFLRANCTKTRREYNGNGFVPFHSFEVSCPDYEMQSDTIKFTCVKCANHCIHPFSRHVYGRAYVPETIVVRLQYDIYEDFGYFDVPVSCRCIKAGAYR